MVKDVAMLSNSLKHTMGYFVGLFAGSMTDEEISACAKAPEIFLMTVVNDLFTQFDMVYCVQTFGVVEVDNSGMVSNINVSENIYDYNPDGCLLFATRILAIAYFLYDHNMGVDKTKLIRFFEKAFYEFNAYDEFKDWLNTFKGYHLEAPNSSSIAVKYTLERKLKKLQ